VPAVTIVTNSNPHVVLHQSIMSIFDEYDLKLASSNSVQINRNVTVKR